MECYPVQACPPCAHLPGHSDRFGVMASINSLSSTKCRIFVDEASKKDLPSTKCRIFVDEASKKDLPSTKWA